MLAKAVPLLTRTGLPRLVIPSLNCTVPTAAGVTVAVNAIGVPCVAGKSADVIRVTVVGVACRTLAGGTALNASPVSSGRPMMTNASPPMTVATMAPEVNSANGFFSVSMLWLTTSSPTRHRSVAGKWPTTLG